MSNSDNKQNIYEDDSDEVLDENRIIIKGKKSDQYNLINLSQADIISLSCMYDNDELLSTIQVNKSNKISFEQGLMIACEHESLNIVKHYIDNVLPSKLININKCCLTVSKFQGFNDIYNLLSPLYSAQINSSTRYN